MTVVRVDEPQRFRAATALLTIPGIWQRFAPVPDEFYRREGTTAVIECPCGYGEEGMREQRYDFGELGECPGCERFYFNGTRLHAAKGEREPYETVEVGEYDVPLLDRSAA